MLNGIEKRRKGRRNRMWGEEKGGRKYNIKVHGREKEKRERWKWSRIEKENRIGMESEKNMLNGKLNRKKRREREKRKNIIDKKKMYENG